MSVKEATKKIANVFGLHSSDRFWIPLALRQHRKRYENDPAFKVWMEKYAQRWITTHWGHEETNVDIHYAQLSSQLYGITEMLRKRIGPINGDKVLDAGASDGMFLTLLGVKNGIGINILPACVEKIRSDGHDAMLGNVEALPFEDKSFDYVICCETIEHVLNPVQALNELARVCRKKVFMTIPWLPRTRLNRKPDGWPEKESHIFEFSPQDFQKVVTWSRLRPTHHDLIQVFPEPRNPLMQWWFKCWMYPNNFPKLQYYELIPEDSAK